MLDAFFFFVKFISRNVQHCETEKQADDSDWWMIVEEKRAKLAISHELYSRKFSLVNAYLVSRDCKYLYIETDVHNNK